MSLSDSKVRNAKPREKHFKFYDTEGMFLREVQNAMYWVWVCTWSDGDGFNGFMTDVEGKSDLLVFSPSAIACFCSSFSIYYLFLHLCLFFHSDHPEGTKFRIPDLGDFSMIPLIRKWSDLYGQFPLCYHLQGNEWYQDKTYHICVKYLIYII